MRKPIALLIALAAVTIAGYFVAIEAVETLRILQTAGHGWEPFPVLRDGEYRGATAEQLDRYLRAKYGSTPSDDIVDPESLEPHREEPLVK